MIDLRDDAINKHWSKADKSTLIILDNMRIRENWTLDEKTDLKKELIRWAENVSDKKLKEAIGNQAEAEALMKILAFMKSKRSLFLLSNIEKKFPGSTEKLINETVRKISTQAGDTRAEEIFNDRLLSLLRIGLIERIFSEERSEKIKQAIQASNKKYGGVRE